MGTDKSETSELQSIKSSQVSRSENGECKSKSVRSPTSTSKQSLKDAKDEVLEEQEEISSVNETVPEDIQIAKYKEDFDDINECENKAQSKNIYTNKTGPASFDSRKESKQDFIEKNSKFIKTKTEQDTSVALNSRKSQVHDGDDPSFSMSSHDETPPTRSNVSKNKSGVQDKKFSIV